MPPVPDRLELRGPEFTARAMAFSHMMSVPDFQRRFFANPSAVAAQEFGLKASAAQLSRSNKLVHTLLSDPKFNAWAKDFQARIESSFPQIANAKDPSELPKLLRAKSERDKVVSEFSASVQQFLGPEANKLTAAGATKPGVLVSEGDVALVLLTFVAVIVIVVVAAGVARPNEVVSRMTLQLSVNQLTREHTAAIGRAGG